jgi:hypothetical protein
MDVSAGEGWTRRQEQGEEVDFEVSPVGSPSVGLSLEADGYQALKLVKTNHDVNVKVADQVDLGGLPGECNLMAVSNTWGILAVGGNTGMQLQFIRHYETDIVKVFAYIAWRRFIDCWRTRRKMLRLLRNR